MSIAEREWLAVAFLEDPDLIINLTPEVVEDETPNYFNRSSDIIGLERYDRQTVNRIWMFDQTSECLVWRSITMDNIGEVLDQRRQELRGTILCQSHSPFKRQIMMSQNRQSNT